MTAAAHDAYRTIRTTTSDPVTLTTMLYDGAIKAMRRARMLEAQGERQRFMDEIERAHLIVGELLVTLDREQGGEIAESLASIYGYCLRCLVGATLGKTGELDEAEKHITRVAEAWKTATAGLRANGGVQYNATAAA